MEVDLPEPLKTLYVGNLGAHLIEKDVQDLLRVTNDEFQKGYGLELKTKNDINYALFTAPEKRVMDLLKLNGTEFMGRKLNVELSAHSLPPPTNAALSGGSSAGGGGGQDNDGVASTFAEAAAPSRPMDPNVRKYVEFDSCIHFDCYNIPKTSTIVYAVSQQFKNDRSKRLFPRRQGKWVLETDDITHYTSSDHLLLDGRILANISVKAQRVVVDESGKTVYERVQDDRENDLLITLYQGDTARFQDITHDQIYQKIADIGIGTIKKGIAQQMHYESDIPNGNLFFVITGVDKAKDVDRIPHAFDFLTPSGPQRMWLNFKGKKRKCFFCSEVHDVSHCPVKERVKLMEEERKRMREDNNGHLKIKTYGDSTVRHWSQAALSSDVDAMSGGTTCNIINAIEVDRDNMDVENLLIVAGQNEINPRHTKEEFLWILKNKTERLVNLAENRKIAILSPPPQGFQDAESQTREFMYHENLSQIAQLSTNIHVWKNPLPSYSMDDGRHPSEEESVGIIKFLNEKVKELFKESLIMEAASDDLMTTTNYYRGVNDLYKYGCAACPSKARNKWPLLCDACVANASVLTNEELKTAVQDYDAAVEKQYMAMNPPLSGSVGEVPPVVDATGRDRSPIKHDDLNDGGNGSNLKTISLTKSDENKVRKIVNNLDGNKKNKKKKTR